MQEKTFAFIPWWISAVLVRNNLKSEDLLSFERIRPFFSTEDLASLVATSFVARYFVCNGIGSDITQFYDRWQASASDARTKQAIADIAALAFSNEVQDETLRRLVTETPSKPSTMPSTGPSATYEVALMGDVGVAVYLKQGFTLAQHNANSFDLLRSMVKKLYVYEDYPQLVSRAVGDAYTESLMH
jgi:hypothetical protein